MLLSVIIPAYNEENTIARVIDNVLEKSGIETEIIVVDDGSTDGTAEIVTRKAAHEPRVRLCSQPVNQGKTAALVKGFSLSRGDIVIVQDADLEYDPAEIHVVIEPIVHDRADVVYGSRFLVRTAARALYYRHFMANKLITMFSNLLTDINLSDVETGYKAFRGDIIRKMKINSSGFGFEIEVTAKIAKLGCRIFEVPISYYGRTYEEGKKIGLRDGLAALFYIVKYNWFVSLSGSFTQLPQKTWR